MVLQVLPATREDVPRLAEIIFDAFTRDPLHAAMFPRQHQDTFMDWYHQKLVRAMMDPAIRTMKIVQSSGHDNENNIIIAYGRWEFPRGVLPGPQVMNTEEQEISFPFPALGNEPLVEHYIDKTNAMRKRLVDENSDFVCQMLATDTKFQGQGAARLLLQYGINAAAKVGIDAGKSSKIFLEATPEAHGLYKKFGWVDIDCISIQLEVYGVLSGNLHQTFVMERK